MSSILSVDPAMNAYLELLKQCDDKDNELTSMDNVVRREMLHENKEYFLQMYPKIHDHPEELKRAALEVDKDAMNNLENSISNTLYRSNDNIDDFILSDIRNDCKGSKSNSDGSKNTKKVEKTFGETVPFEQFSEDLNSGLYGKACASLGLDLLGLLPSAGPQFRGSLEKIVSFIKSHGEDENSNDENNYSENSENIEKENDNLLKIINLYNYTRPNNVLSDPIDDSNNIKEEKPVSILKDNVYKINQSSSSIYNEQTILWKSFRPHEISEKTTEFSEKLHKFFIKLKYTGLLSKNFLNSLSDKIVYFDDDKVSTCNIINETPTQHFQRYFLNYNDQQLISTYTQPGILKIAEDQLLEQCPEINQRFSQNMRIIYRINKIDDDKFKISVIKHAYLRPSMLHSSNDIHVYGIRADMLVSKTSNPDIQYSYFTM